MTDLETRELLSCRLTDSEIGRYSAELSGLVLGLEELEEEARETAKEFREQIKARKKSQTALASKIRSRSEVRAVKCKIVPNLEAGLVDVIRLDTGELVRSREMSAEEERAFRQQRLELDGPSDGLAILPADQPGGFEVS